MKIKKIILCLLVLMLMGCEGSQFVLERMSSEELKTSFSHDLCNAYCYGKSNKIRNELEQRMLFTKEEWQRIDRNAFCIGDSRLLLIASWGKLCTINRTVIQGGIYEQWVYGSTYVYLEDGVITGWQD